MRDIYIRAGMGLSDIEKELRLIQNLFDAVSISTIELVDGDRRLEILCRLINTMIEEDCDVYKKESYS